MEQRKQEVLLAVRPEGRPGEQHRPEAVLLEEQQVGKQEELRRPVVQPAALREVQREVLHKLAGQ